jgi:aspartyl-tRNA(Asn)/glutamyl-tRNA(Gln) amidotransferase subunit C
MQIDRAMLDKIAHLSRLEFDEKDAEQMMKDMSAILTWVEKLNEVNTDGVEPLTTMSQEINRFREDEVKPSLPHDKALSSAPSKDADYFLVPKVLD